MQVYFSGLNSSSVGLDVFEMGIVWKDMAFKVDGLKKGFNHMTDWTLNQVPILRRLVNLERLLLSFRVHL